jgi:hypothetical protein
MATTYDDIRDLFLSKITSFELADMLDNEVNEMTDKYLMIAISRFYNCVQDLNNRNDLNRTFNISLNLQEQDVLASLMGIAWLSPKLLREENLRDMLGSKDYTSHSPANLLDKLTNLKKVLESEINDLLTLYHYTN